MGAPSDPPLDLHLDCFSGLAGDMFLGACLDLGMPLGVIEEVVEALALPGVTVESRPALRGGLTGTRFRVLLDGQPVEGADPEEVEAAAADGDEPTAVVPVQRDAGHRHLSDIRRMIEDGRLDPAVRELALRLFERLGEAEAKVHGIPLERVHFHEVGAVDSIVDLVGAAAAMVYLAPGRVTAGPVNVGSGTVATAHGRLPVPAPATAELLRGVPVYGSGEGELLTPTGAVILAELVDGFGPLPAMTIAATGHGHGKRRLPGWANTVRLLRGRPGGAAGAAGGPRVAVLETEVDDLTGEGFGFLMERLLEAGALDVYFTPLVMKKSRPGTLVTVLCRPSQRDELATLLLAESGALGCRWHEAERLEAERESGCVATPYGTVRVKRARLAGRSLTAAPEDEDCRRLARQAGVPWRQVYGAALAALAAGEPETTQPAPAEQQEDDG